MSFNVLCARTLIYLTLQVVMGNRLVGNVAILGTVLLRIANVYDKLFDDEQFAVLEVRPQW